MPVPEQLAELILKTPRWSANLCIGSSGLAILERLVISDRAELEFAGMNYGEHFPPRSAKRKGKSIPPRDTGPGLAIRRPPAAARVCR